MILYSLVHGDPDHKKRLKIARETDPTGLATWPNLHRALGSSGVSPAESPWLLRCWELAGHSTPWCSPLRRGASIRAWIQCVCLNNKWIEYMQFWCVWSVWIDLNNVWLIAVCLIWIQSMLESIVMLGARIYEWTKTNNSWICDCGPSWQLQPMEAGRCQTFGSVHLPPLYARSEHVDVRHRQVIIRFLHGSLGSLYGEQILQKRIRNLIATKTSDFFEATSTSMAVVALRPRHFHARCRFP